MANMNQQLVALVRQGFSVEDAAAAMGLDISAANLALKAIKNKDRKVDLTELVEEFKEEAVTILMDIARNGEKDGDRVKACQLLLTGEGIMPEVNAHDIGKKMIMFDQALKRANGIVIDVGSQAEAANG